MKRFLLAAFCLTFCHVAGLAQTFATAASSCLPNLRVEAEPTLANPGETITVKALFDPLDEKLKVAELKFVWKLAGREDFIGQGTPEIRFIQSKNLREQSFTASVEVTWLAANCSNTASVSATVCLPPSATLFDEYAKISSHEEEIKLDKLAIELENNSSARTLITIFTDEKIDRTQSESRLRKIYKYLVANRGIDAQRILLAILHDEDGERTQLFIVPTGAALPLPENHELFKGEDSVVN